MPNLSLPRVVSPNSTPVGLQVDELERTCLCLCRESRRQVDRQVTVVEETPRTLWCRAESPSASGSGVGDSTRRNQCNIPSDSTSITISGNEGESVEPAGAISEGAIRVCAENEVYSPDVSPDQSASSSNAPSSKGHGEQNGRTELQAGERKGAGSPITAKAGILRTHKAVDEGTVCLEGGGCGAKLGLAVPTPVLVATAGSLVSSRVPLARVTDIPCMLPAKDLTAEGFRWRDGVKKIKYTGNSSDTFEVLSLMFDGLSEPGCVSLPLGLKRVNFEANWNIELHATQRSFSDSLEYICFPRCFNQPLAEHGARLPRGLLEIEMGETFNQSLIGVDWPPLLQKLTFRDGFDQPLDGVRFPPGLREIHLLGKYNRDLRGVIWPKGLEYLALGDVFDQALSSPHAEGGASRGRQHALPDGLKNLHLGVSFDHSLSGSELPDGLEVLSVGRLFDFTASPVRWPSALKYLYVKSLHMYDDLILRDLPMELPPKLERLTINFGFSLPLRTFAWSPTLKVLDLGHMFNYPIGEYGDVTLLPDGLEELKLGAFFNRSIENIRLPAGLKRLIFENETSMFNQRLSGVMWPPGLEELTLGCYFNKPMEGTTFPETLRELSFGATFCQSLQGVALPDGLTHLTLSSCYPGRLVLELDWPRSLRSLNVGGDSFSCRDDLAIFAARFV